MKRFRCAIPFLVAAGVCVAARPAEAQRSLTVSGGPASYDLAGTGWSGIVGAHVENTRRTWFALEYGASLFWYRPQFNQRTIMLLPEVGIALQGPRYVPLRLAIGVGHSLTVSGDQPQDPILYTGLGLSFAVNDDWRVRPELRVHLVDPFHGGIGGFTLGISRRLGT